MRTTSNRPLRHKLVAIAGLAALSVGVAACGNDSDSGTSSTSASSSQSAPKPVASLDTVTGTSTAIKLDTGFTDALTTLGLTPGVTGDAKLTDGSLVFPITGGNVTVFKPGQVSPYVIGQLQHVDSGLTLTAGDTTVKLSNLNVDPGVSRVYGDVEVNGQSAAKSAFLFQLDGRTLEPLKTEGTDAILTGTKVEISPVAADLLNQTFKTDAVKAGLLVGIATIRWTRPPAPDGTTDPSDGSRPGGTLECRRACRGTGGGAVTVPGLRHTDERAGSLGTLPPSGSPARRCRSRRCGPWSQARQGDDRGACDGGSRPSWWPHFTSPIRSTAVTARLGRLVGICFVVCFVTGMLSHYQYHPWSWLPEPAARCRPTG